MSKLKVQINVQCQNSNLKIGFLHLEFRFIWYLDFDIWHCGLINDRFPKGQIEDGG
jgi:hypothetical protein